MAPQAQPIVSVDEIDEALWWVVLTAPRDEHYARIVDSLLDQRNRVSPDPQGQGAHLLEQHPRTMDHPSWDSTESRPHT